MLSPEHGAIIGTSIGHDHTLFFVILWCTNVKTPEAVNVPHILELLMVALMIGVVGGGLLGMLISVVVYPFPMVPMPLPH